MRRKIHTADEAVSVIRDGDTVSISGFVGVGTPDELLLALERRFLNTGHPQNLTLVFAAAPGDGGDRGLNCLAHKGLVKRAIGGHWSLVPKLAKMAVNNEIEAYNLPLGCISQLFRVVAGGKVGLHSKVGLKTFVDPRLQGGKVNEITTEDLVKLVDIDGEEWLFYKAIKIDVSLLRGTTADPRGNVSMESEVLKLDVTSTAMATHNSDGVVITQVKRIAETGSLKPKQVMIPGTLVDSVVIAEKENHFQTYATEYNHAFTGELRVPMEFIPIMPLDQRKIIARRAALELPIGGVVNLGIGIPEGVACVAAEEDLLSYVTLTAEPGVIGGMPQGGLDFGAALNSEAIIAQNSQFDFYDGGGLDIACLGMAETDQYGNVNVSRFGPRFAGAGGFINISQNASRLVLAGTFTAGGLEIEINNGLVTIIKEGKCKKFVKDVEQITFSGLLAAERQQPVLYVTERCVFSVTLEGLELVEVAPGIDIERDILAHMDFTPIMDNVKLMDQRIFRKAPMNLKSDSINAPIEKRIKLSDNKKSLEINFREFSINTKEELLFIEKRIRDLCNPLQNKVDMVAWYDGFSLNPDLDELFTKIVASLQEQYYVSTTRYTRDPFIRLKFGAELVKRDATTLIKKDSVAQ